MPADHKPLFRPEAIRPKVREFLLPPEADPKKLQKWAGMLKQKSSKKLKETELRDEFLYDIFRDALGYVTVSENPTEYTFKKEQFVEAGGTYADAGFGRFHMDGRDEPALVLEGKGPDDPLDRPFKSRKRSAYEQAVLYAINLKIDWFLVTNVYETRLYCKQADQFTFERFETAKLADNPDEWKRFVYLLGAKRVLGPQGNHLKTLLEESKHIGLELTNKFYREYRELRQKTFEALRTHNPSRDPYALLNATQKLLDRILFITFCKDRGLLPHDAISRAYAHSDPYNPRPIWDNFKSLFHKVDKGDPKLEINEYNGKLYAPDPFLDALTVPDEICSGFKEIDGYYYGQSGETDKKLIDVEILGHVFEQSISDLEEMQNILDGKLQPPKSKEQKKTARKEAGAFYTPAFITRYIVQQTLGPVVDARFEAFRMSFRKSSKVKKGIKVLDDPREYELADLTSTERSLLRDFWGAWLGELETIKIVDPSCGSGAFLLEAFAQMYERYKQAGSYFAELDSKPSLFDIRKTILEHNLYGVDLNSAAVGIARLSCWIQTAEGHKKLTSLDHNFRHGNSVVDDPAIHPDAFNWKSAFPEVFAAGGFDVVIGNPPYVRQEWIKEYKGHWEAKFDSYDSTADLFVYFYELGLQLLRPHGRLGFISSGGWVRGGYGEKLREFLSKNAGLESMIDFGEFQPFEDAEMIRPTITIASQRDPGGPMKLWKWLTNGRPPETLSDEIAKAPFMRTDRLAKNAWELESDEAVDLRTKLSSKSVSLSKYVGKKLYVGIKSALSDVYSIDSIMYRYLINDDPKSQELIVKFLQGTNLRDFYIDESDSYLLAIKSSDNYAWPWADAGGDAEAIFAKTYPAIHGYLDQYREACIKRSDQGRYWWELRSCSYWSAFEEPKIVWPDITNYPRFSMDTEKRYLGNTGYIIPGGDYFLLGILSSWATWFFISKTAQPLRLRSNRWQYRLIAQYMEHVPIPDAAPSEREAIAKLAETCNTLGNERYKLEEAFRHRLLTTFRGTPEDKLNEKAQEWWQHDLIGLGDALKTSFKRKQNPFTSPRTADEWEPYWKTKLAEVEELRRKLSDAEAEINERVYKLFCLTPDEIKLLKQEVEH
jgi:hypothetical protein